jgi:hypothetical protein
MTHSTNSQRPTENPLVRKILRYSQLRLIELSVVALIELVVLWGERYATKHFPGVG